MKSLMLVVAAALNSAPAGLDQDSKPAQPPAQAPAPAPADKPADAPKADEPKPVHSETKENGLILEDFVIGTGATVQPGALVAVHYRGTLRENGNEFDSSYKRGEPITFPLKGLIQGWQDGIPGMKVGGKRRLTIPWALAYGEAGRPPVIPAKADLVFDIEVIDTLVSQDVKVGDGAPFTPGLSPTIKYTLKRLPAGGGSGEVVASSGDEAKTYDFRALFMALQFGLEGMKVGGKRTLSFPALMAWQQKPAPLPAATRMECEVELINAVAPGR